MWLCECCDKTVNIFLKSLHKKSQKHKLKKELYDLKNKQ